jgi:hypothetical protein
VRAGAWRLRTCITAFGLALAAAIDDDGTTLVMLHKAPGPADDMFTAIRENRSTDFARMVSRHFADPVVSAGRCHPSRDLDRASAAMDIATALTGAVVEILPDSSFVSAMVQWGPAGCFASIGCDEPIGDPKRPLLAERFEAMILDTQPALTLREGSAWKTIADQIIPDLESVVDMGVVVMDPTIETQVERDALSYLRAVADGREASARLAIPVGERLLQPPI